MLNVLPTATGIDALTALELAKNANLETVLIMGWKPDGSLYVGGTNHESRDILWILSVVQHAQSGQE